MAGAGETDLCRDRVERHAGGAQQVLGALHPDVLDIAVHGGSHHRLEAAHQVAPADPARLGEHRDRQLVGRQRRDHLAHPVHLPLAEAAAGRGLAPGPHHPREPDQEARRERLEQDLARMAGRGQLGRDRVEQLERRHALLVHPEHQPLVIPVAV